MTTRCRRHLRIYVSVLLLAVCAPVRADYFADVGYTALRAELGSSLPVASGVPVMIVEANRHADPGVVAYAPDVSDAEFRGKKITVGEGGPRVYAPFSGHATGVGRRFFGLQSSVSPGIVLVASYLTSQWFGPALLRLGEVRQPRASLSRVASHAWVGNAARAVADPANSEALRRVDWLVETDEFFHVVGFNAGSQSPLLADAFNVLSVANTGIDRHRATLAIDADYVAGRPRPHLVVPDKTPSASTGRAASVAALLIGIGHSQQSLSHGATTNRHGSKIYNAERSEVIKAALLAGADRTTANSSGIDIVGYRADRADRTNNGLDRRYGAGQLNVAGSYRILTGAEQDSAEDQVTGGRISAAGFDFDASFGGLTGSNRQATYRFSTGNRGGHLAISLVWNMDIRGGSLLAFDARATLYDLDLVLYDVSGNKRVVVAESRSGIDNSENIYVELSPRRAYLVRVLPGVGQAPFYWDYGIAWRFVEKGGG